MKFKLDIGDWSNDGHGKTQTILFDAKDATEKQIRAAYKLATQIVPKHLHPESICDEYECSSVTTAVGDEIKKYYGIKFGEDEYDGKIWVSAESMGDLVAAFLAKGGVKTKVIDDTITYIQLGSIGYGVLS